MSSKFFTKDIIKLLLQNQPEGVIIYDGSWEPDENSNELYSTDINTTQGIGTPQSDYSFSRRYNWNNYGNGIMYESLPFPVVRASDDEIGFLQRLCSENRDYGIYSNRVNVGEFRFYMGHDSITSNECLAWTDTYGNRRPQCLPIGGSSIWSSADTLNNKPKVIITTGIDSTAFFHDLAYGGNDAVASIATLLIAIEALGRYQDLSNLQYQPLFFFANAEEWGYAGSRRFVRDITEGISCEFNVSESNSPTGLPFCTSPIYPTTLFEQIGQAGIREILAIDQVGKLKNGQLFLHSLASNPDTFNTIITSSSNIEGVTVTASTSTSRIPPTPMSSFLNSIPSLKSNGVVITGYDTNFNDPLFHTRFDTADKIVVNDIILSAQVVLQSVLGISGGDVSLAPNVNETLASEIIDCLSTNWHCSLIQKYVSFEKKNLGEYLGGDVYFDSGTTPPNYYTGVLEASTGGLPVIQHSHYVYGDYPEKWDLKHDRVYSIPNYLESFIRTFSSYHLTPIQSRNNNNNNFESSEDYEVECKTSLDCNNCTILSYSNVKMECILNECICPLSYYHLALDPGIKSDLQANYFSIIDKSAVSYTEPYWSHIGVKVYPDVGNGLPMTTFAIGIVICFLSIIGAIGANFYMGKIKAL